MTTSKPKLLLRVTEAAELLSISKSRAYELIKQGELPSLKLGGNIRVPYEALQAMVIGALQNKKENYGTR